MIGRIVFSSGRFMSRPFMRGVHLDADREWVVYTDKCSDLSDEEVKRRITAMLIRPRTVPDQFSDDQVAFLLEPWLRENFGDELSSLSVSQWTEVVELARADQYKRILEYVRDACGDESART